MQPNRIQAPLPTTPLQAQTKPSQAVAFDPVTGQQISNQQLFSQRHNQQQPQMFTALVTRDLKRKFDGVYTEYKLQRDSVSDVQPRSVQQHLTRQTGEYFKTLRQELERQKLEVRERIKQSTKLQRLETLLGQNQECMKPSQNFLQEDRKLQSLVEKGRYATIVKNKDYIESVIKVVSDQTAQMGKIKQEGSQLLEEIVAVTKPVTGLERICDDMIRVDVSSQPDEQTMSVEVVEAPEEQFSVMPQGNLFFRAMGPAAKHYQQKGITADGVYHSKNIVLPSGQCFRVGGSQDSECQQAVRTCMVDNTQVKPMNVARGMVGLCVAMLQSEQNPTYSKDYVIAFGGCQNKKAVKTVEKYSIKADMWMALPDLNQACAGASGTILLDHLYVFGGKNEFGQYMSRIERLNLKNPGAKWELIDVHLHEPATDVGLLPLKATPTSAEVMIMGGYNGRECLGSQYRFTAAVSCQSFAVLSDGSQEQHPTEHVIEPMTAQIKPDFFTGSTMATTEDKGTVVVHGAQRKHYFNDAGFLYSV